MLNYNKSYCYYDGYKTKSGQSNLTNLMKLLEFI